MMKGVPVKGVRIAVAGRYGNRHLEGTKISKTMQCRQWNVTVGDGTEIVLRGYSFVQGLV